MFGNVVVKMLKALPGPRILPKIGTAWTYLPLVGHGFSPDRLHEAYLGMYERYGEIVHEVLRGRHIVSLYNPKHIKTVVLGEATEAYRLSHGILKKFRESRPDLFNSVGVVPSNGLAWFEIRKAAEKEFRASYSRSKVTRMFNESAQEYIDFLVQLGQHQDGVVKNIVEYMHHWALENIAILVLDKRLDSYSTNRKEICYELIDSGLEYLDGLAKAEISNLWENYETSTYKKVARNDLFFYYFIKEFVDSIIASGEIGKPETEDTSLLTRYLNAKMDVRDVISVAADLMLAGHLTTAFAASFILYVLGQNEEKQEILYKVLKAEFPSVKDMYVNSGQAGSALQRGIKYLDYTYSEGLRLYPVTIGNGRVVTKQTPLTDDYILRPNTIVLTQNQVASRLPEYLSNPDVFLPERWEPDEDKKARGTERSMLKYLAIPFGYGHRMCLGKVASEQQTKIFLARVNIKR